MTAHLSPRLTSHLGRDVAAIIVGIVALSVAGWILVGFGFALIVAMMTIVAAAALISVHRYLLRGAGPSAGWPPHVATSRQQSADDRQVDTI